MFQYLEYRQTNMFRIDAIRRAEQHRLIKVAKLARRIFRPTFAQIEVK